MLCSNGLTCKALRDQVRQEPHKLHKEKPRAALIVTSDPIYKEKNYHIARCLQELESLGFSVDLFDFDYQRAEMLLAYDCAELIGGNPYTLLQSLRKSQAQPILKELAKHHILIGWSAGALVLGPTIDLIEQYFPEMNTLNLTDLTGMNLTSRQILPHYHQFLNRDPQYEILCQAYEQDHHCEIIRLSDGEGIIIDSENDSFIRIQ